MRQSSMVVSMFFNLILPFLRNHLYNPGFLHPQKAKIIQVHNHIYGSNDALYEQSLKSNFFKKKYYIFIIVRNYSL